MIPKCQNSFCFHVDTKEKEELSSESTFFLEAMILQYQPLTFKMNIEIEINESENK